MKDVLWATAVFILVFIVLPVQSRIINEIYRGAAIKAGVGGYNYKTGSFEFKKAEMKIKVGDRTKILQDGQYYFGIVRSVIINPDNTNDIVVSIDTGLFEQDPNRVFFNDRFWVEAEQTLTELNKLLDEEAKEHKLDGYEFDQM
jgi:hypothetical protein